MDERVEKSSEPGIVSHVKMTPIHIPLGASCLVLLGALLGFGFIEYRGLQRDLRESTETLKATKIRFEADIAELQEKLKHSEAEKLSLSEALENEKDKMSVFEEQIDKITGTVGTLTKLSQTDPELLYKYSKVYFLNEHYIPKRLITINREYLYNQDTIQQFSADAWPYLRNLLEEAKEDGVDLQIISAYRSFGTQAILKSSYTVTYGAGTANQFSADQGYSEHQLGTTVDFTTQSTGSTFSGFENTESYEWLHEEAHRYGFVLSYPPGNSYYQFEPWHWRFVGVDLARDLHRDNKYFYDLEQREINEYLVTLFD